MSSVTKFVYLFGEKAQFQDVWAAGGPDFQKTFCFTVPGVITGQEILVFMKVVPDTTFMLPMSATAHLANAKKEGASELVFAALKLRGTMRGLQSLMRALRKPCPECTADDAETIVGVCKAHSNAEVYRCVLSMVAQRQATLPEDLIYSVYGTLHPRLPQVVYGCGLAAARDAVLLQMPSAALIGAISSDWCGPSALPNIVDGRPTSGFVLGNPTAHATFDAGAGMSLIGRTERSRVWDTNGMPSVRSREECNAYPLIRGQFGSGPASDMHPKLLHAVSLDDHPGYTSCSKAEVDICKLHSVWAGFKVDKEDGLEMVMVELGKCTHEMCLEQAPYGVLTMAVTQLGSAEQQYHGLALINRASHLEGPRRSVHFS